MIDPADLLRGASVACVFPGCGCVLAVGSARVMVGGKTIADITDRALCPAHSKAAEARSHKCDWLLVELRSFVRKATEDKVADDFFASFGKKESVADGERRVPTGMRHEPTLRRGESRLRAVTASR